MSKKGVFYGSSTGNTQSAAEAIAKGLGIDKADVIDITKASQDSILSYDALILGSSTWGVGDLQDDWEDFIGKLKKINLSDKKVAVFGTGDSSSYSDTFCDAIGIIAEVAQQAGATITGKVETSGYTFDESKAVWDGVFCGLPLDDDNESDKTDERISNWVTQLKSELEF